MAGYTLTRVPTAVYPLFLIIAGAASFAGWYVARLATRPDVVWARKSNPFPYLSVQQDQTIKMMNPNGRFASKWSRTQL